MKIGMIFECGPSGADKIVCQYLAQKLFRIKQQELLIEPITLDNKKNLIQECASHAQHLLSIGCDQVLIIWDLYPAWRSKKQKPCRKQDCDSIIDQLDELGVNRQKIALVCIEEELEAWLLADERALIKVLGTPSRKPRIKPERKPDQVQNPKGRLSQLFKEHRGNNYKYEDRIHAERIVRAIPDFTRLKRSLTFQRFALKLADIEL